MRRPAGANSAAGGLSEKLKIIIITGMTVADLQRGDEAAVIAVAGEDAIAQRLAEIGFTRGTRVRLIRRAPLGDPLQVRLRGFDVALRRTEARRITVAP